MGSNRTQTKDIPSCCKTKDDSFEDFNPVDQSSVQGESELFNASDGEEFAGNDNNYSFSIIDPTDYADVPFNISRTPKSTSQRSNLRPTSAEKSYTFSIMNPNNYNLSFIKPPTPKGKREKSLPSCCQTKAKPIEKKLIDPTITSAPGPSRREQTLMSKSLSSSVRDRYDTSRGETGSPRHYPNSIYERSNASAVASPYASYYSSASVPRPSRNYHTYEDQQPKYYSTPLPTAAGYSFNQTWGSTLNDSIKSRQSPSVRQSPFSTPKQPTYVPRPRKFWNANVDTRRPSPPAFNFAQNQDFSNASAASESMRSSPHPSYRSQSRSLQGTIPSFSDKPHSTPIQRRSPQRPQTAYMSPGLPAWCRMDDSRPKTAEASLQPSKHCVDHSCGNPSKNVESCCNDATCSEINLVSDRTQTDIPQSNVGCQIDPAKPDKCGGGCGQKDEEVETLNTLLEIRTPHKTGEGATGLPFILSINVQCAEKSVVLTPEKGFKSIRSNTSSQV